MVFVSPKEEVRRQTGNKYHFGLDYKAVPSNRLAQDYKMVMYGSSVLESSVLLYVMHSRMFLLYRKDVHRYRDH